MAANPERRRAEKPHEGLYHPAIVCIRVEDLASPGRFILLARPLVTTPDLFGLIVDAGPAELLASARARAVPARTRG